MSNKANVKFHRTHRGPMGMRHGGFEKPKNFKKALRKMVSFARPYLALILTAVIFAIFGTVFSIVGPKKLGSMTNLVQDAYIKSLITGVFLVDMKKITSIGILLICIYIASSICGIIQGQFMNVITQKMSKKLRTQISKKINLLPLKYFDNQHYGDILSRVTNDVDTISQSLNNSISSLITAITLLIGITIMMFRISWKMTVIAFITLPISAIFMMIIMRFSQKYFRKQQESLGELNGHIEETYSGHNVLKVFNASHKKKQEFAKINQELSSSSWKGQFISGLMMPLMTFVGNLSYIAVCVVGGILAANQELKIGDIQSMMTYVQRFTQPLGQIAQSMNQLQSAAAAAERVFEFLEAEQMEDESSLSTKLNNIKGNVEFKNVVFGYDEDKIIIKNFSACAKAGQKIAIVGPTGAGKTTIVNLLMKFYPLNGGDILIDNVSINELTRENVHDLFGMVLQDTWLFNGTIYDNLAYGRKSCTIEEVINACKTANIHHFIESLPGGYSMILDEDSNISQGEKQLLTIARAMIENAPMLILDEATSSVDTRTEIVIQNAMDQLAKGRTSFVIAHRLSTIKNADLILVMKDGDIIETGKHEELLTKNGFYAELYNSQFES